MIARPDALRERDALIDLWLDESEGGRSLLCRRTKAEAHAELAELNDRGLGIEAVPANDMPMNRHERRAAGRRARP